jgi:hypothetical protein
MRSPDAALRHDRRADVIAHHGDTSSRCRLTVVRKKTRLSYFGPDGNTNHGGLLRRQGGSGGLPERGIMRETSLREEE